MQIFKKTPNIDFVRWRWHAMALSLAILLVGAFLVRQSGLPRGVEFSGGTIVILQFDETPDLARIRAALPGGGQSAVVQRYGAPEERLVMIRMSTVGAESGGQLSETKEAIEAALREANVGNFREEGTEIVGPIVGEQLTRQGLLATVLALCAILVYIAFRFQLSFAVGAITGVVHDLLIVLSFMVFFRYELSLNVIAGLLTIAGYSVNDTIVVFDRVRENLRSMRRDKFAAIINASVNQTLARTLITSGTTLGAALSLFLFGGEVLNGFAFVLLVGVISGTYSTVFIAAAVAVGMQRGRPLKGQIATSESAAATRKPGRRRAS